MNKEQKEILQSQLNNEKQTIKELKEVYETALKDCETKIKELSMRKDLENIQSIIYQKQYQQAIRGQLEGILEQMHGDSFATVSDYLARCYEDGYIGTMYDLAGQGIPLIIPIDQDQVVKAIQTDSKLSKSLYDRLGEDVSELKKAVRQEVSRGIASGSSWVDVANNLASNFTNTPFSKAFNNSIRIARTEGHRIGIQSAMDAQEKAKKKGADIVKQWDATLDGRTRDSHRLLDGQIRELDEDFEVNGKHASAPSMFGDPAEDINCRCALLQRARWALDDDELATLREKAAYHGTIVDDSEKYGHAKAKDFADFKEKYLQASAIENEAAGLMFKDKPNSTMTAKERFEATMEVSKSYSGMPTKVKQEFSDVTFEFGYAGNSCDILHKKINVAIGTQKEQIDHEYGHLIEHYMMKKSDVDAYKASLTKGLTSANIKTEIYYDNAGNSHRVFVLVGGNFESEYQTRLYVRKKSDALNKDGSINTDCMLECISEPFKKYMNGEQISSEAKKLIEGAIL